MFQSLPSNSFSCPCLLYFPPQWLHHPSHLCLVNSSTAFVCEPTNLLFLYFLNWNQCFFFCSSHLFDTWLFFLISLSGVFFFYLFIFFTFRACYLDLVRGAPVIRALFIIISRVLFTGPELLDNTISLQGSIKPIKSMNLSTVYPNVIQTKPPLLQEVQPGLLVFLSKPLFSFQLSNHFFLVREKCGKFKRQLFISSHTLLLCCLIGGDFYLNCAFRHLYGR